MTDPSSSRAGQAAFDTTPARAPAQVLAWVVLTALAALSLALSLLVVTPEIWLDDPYIGFRYAANLERGLGLVYNAGERVEGYTAWLWVMFAWVAAVFDVDPLRFTQWINGASQVATVLLLFWFGNRGQRSPLCSLLAPALVATHLANVSWSMLGLSANFLMLLVTIGALLLMNDCQRTRSGSLALGFVLLLVALTRFDGLILAAVVMAYAVLVDRQIVKSIPATMVLVVGLGIFNLWRFYYYGHPFPNTFYAKQSTFTEEFAGGRRYVIDFFRNGGPYALVFLTLPLLTLSSRINRKVAIFAALAVVHLGYMSARHLDPAGALVSPRYLGAYGIAVVALFLLAQQRFDRRLLVCAWTTFGHLGYVSVIGGDWMVDFRFILPVLPLLAFMLQESLWSTLERLIPARGTRGVVAAAAALSLLAWNVQPLYSSNWANGKYHTKRQGAYWNAAEALTIGKHLDEALPPDALVAVEWAGIIPYYIRQPVFDIFGLNDAGIMEQDFPGSRMGRAITPEYLVERDPEVVVVVAVLFETAEAARVGIDLRPAGSWIDSFYNELRGPEFGYEVAVTKVGEGAYFPFLIKSGVDWKDDLPR